MRAAECRSRLGRAEGEADVLDRAIAPDACRLPSMMCQKPVNATRAEACAKPDERRCAIKLGMPLPDESECGVFLAGRRAGFAFAGVNLCGGARQSVTSGRLRRRIATWLNLAGKDAATDNGKTSAHRARSRRARGEAGHSRYADRGRIRDRIAGRWLVLGGDHRKLSRRRA